MLPTNSRKAILFFLFMGLTGCTRCDNQPTPQTTTDPMPTTEQTVAPADAMTPAAVPTTDPNAPTPAATETVPVTP